MQATVGELLGLQKVPRGLSLFIYLFFFRLQFTEADIRRGSWKVHFLHWQVHMGFNISEGTQSSGASPSGRQSSASRNSVSCPRTGASACQWGVAAALRAPGPAQASPTTACPARLWVWKSGQGEIPTYKIRSWKQVSYLGHT